MSSPDPNAQPPPDPLEGLRERVRDFLEKDPLYRPLEIQAGFAGNWDYPERVTLWCQVDGGERTFRLDQPYYGQPYSLGIGFEELEYECAECDEFKAWFHIRGFVQDDKPDVGYIEKIGQFPPFDIETPSNMRKFLGTSEPLYKRGLISLSQGFGIGALAYMRRVVEDKARDILLLLAEIREAEGAPADDVRAIRSLPKAGTLTPS